jgi:hypothetical protein
MPSLTQKAARHLFRFAPVANRQHARPDQGRGKAGEVLLDFGRMRVDAEGYSAERGKARGGAPR